MKLKPCEDCRQSKPTSQFNLNKSRSDGFDTKCRDCRRVYRAKYYRDNKAKAIEQVARRNRRIASENSLLIFNYLLEHPCVDCGEGDPIVLDFDHRDPSQKSFNVGREIFCRSSSVVLEEIAKCDVRCSNCHRRKTARDRNSLRYRLAQVPRTRLELVSVL